MCLDLALQWLWGRLAAAALIWSLAWELPYTVGVALKKRQTPKTQKSSLSSLFLCLGTQTQMLSSLTLLLRSSHFLASVSFFILNILFSLLQSLVVPHFSYQAENSLPWGPGSACSLSNRDSVCTVLISPWSCSPVRASLDSLCVCSIFSPGRMV